ncbi:MULTISPECIES: alpha-hydroxy-acid oxidizing protein [Nocardiopsidaceae]|uniref:Alpha-hydroxy-acid oxidizing protein n=1 Tax=Streptomonospora nanhaiensis TaxID=1323731 RepID=A0ABY6YRC0_9ACTN|nr:alpha-hydroxy-acid oxidizing protein [Streptomonospora nanhaiensis]WAE74866.1 alpha-hydroxy-acid oxidizing protein [Streptomonospora nanhaiensis]
MSHFAQYQDGVYADATNGDLPRLPYHHEALRDLAEKAMEPGPFGYVEGSAGRERTADANVAAFARYALRPRSLRPGAENAGDLGVTLFGERYPTPLLTAPVGVLEQVHGEAELAVARGANALGVPMVLSTAASTPMEEVAEAADTWWYQLYWPGDDALAESFVRRATAAGAKAIVVTADTKRLGWRPRDLALGHLPFLRSQGMANYFSDPEFRSRLKADPEPGGVFTEAVFHFLGAFASRSLSTDNIARIRDWTDLPVLVKGVVRGDEAIELVEAGVDGLVVSNHGGRQVDNAVAALDALPEVVEAVGDRAAVLFDSGVRSGADVAVAMALGARAVLLGRPWVYGLAVDGAAGVEHVLRAVLAELQITAELMGRDAADLDRDDVTRR